MYKAVWTPTIGERLCVQREPRNAHDRIGAYCCPKNQERDGCLKVYRCLKVKGALKPAPSVCHLRDVKWSS